MALLELQHVETYYGESHVLFDLSLDVEAGEVTCLLGRNGAGKTTTVRSIIGLTPPRSGRIALRGRDRNIPIPFGPYLAAAGWIALLWGDQIVTSYLHFAGVSSVR